MDDSKYISANMKWGMVAKQNLSIGENLTTILIAMKAHGFSAHYLLKIYCFLLLPNGESEQG